jgi:hypothetical protein
MLAVKRELEMTRLLTLTGVGGSGKMRLAVEVARDLAQGYPDGVWLVELAPLSKEELVPKAVAEALDACCVIVPVGRTHNAAKDLSPGSCTAPGDQYLSHRTMVRCSRIRIETADPDEA